jgi:hypothetical protein
MATAYSGPAPKHLWIVGILSLLWNAYGAYDYTMTALDPAAYIASVGYGSEVTAWFESFPSWAIAAWAIGVWASVVGSILLLLRSRHAATVFLLSLLGALISFGYQFTSDRPAEVAGGAAVIFPIVILIVIGLQWYYARREAAAGVLR